MRRGLMAILIVGVIATLLFMLAPKLKPTIIGHISIRQQICEETNNGVVFKLKAVNTTTRHLNNLSIVLNVANGNNKMQKYINIQLFEEGDTINLEETIVFNDKVQACFATFIQSGNPITTKFIPQGDRL